MRCAVLMCLSASPPPTDCCRALLTAGRIRGAQGISKSLANALWSPASVEMTQGDSGLSLEIRACVLVCVRGTREIHAALPLLAVPGLCFPWTQISPQDRSPGLIRNEIPPGGPLNVR